MNDAVISIGGIFDATGSEISAFTINDTSNFQIITNPVGQESGYFQIRNISTLNDGIYFLRINIIDLAGYENYTIIYFYMDNKVNLTPIIQFISPGYNGDAITVNSTGYLRLEGIVDVVSNNIDNITINDSRWVLEVDPSGTLTSPFIYRNSSSISDGLYWINITIYNTDGNSTSLIRYFCVDCVIPTSPSYIDTVVSGNNVTLVWQNVLDATNVTFLIFRNGINIFNTTSLFFQDINLTVGTYIYEVYAMDNAGNIGLAASKTVVISSDDGYRFPTDWIIIIIVIIVVGAVLGVGAYMVIKRRSKQEEGKKTSLKSKKDSENLEVPKAQKNLDFDKKTDDVAA